MWNYWDKVTWPGQTKYVLSDVNIIDKKIKKKTLPKSLSHIIQNTAYDREGISGGKEIKYAPVF